MSYTFLPARQFGRDLLLEIWPPSRDNSLVPSDGADEYLLNQIFEDYKENLPSKIAVVNDTYGAITLSLHKSLGACISDSSLSRQSIVKNCELNVMDLEIPFVTTFDDLSKEIDFVVMKIPKSIALFKFQLEKIRASLGKEVTIYAGGMNKYLPANFYETFEEQTNDSSYSLVKKRARYYKGTLKLTTGDTVQKEEVESFTWENLKFTTLPGVFSYGQLDRGTQFLLEHFPRVESPGTIVDPGCGSGVLAIKAAKTWPEAKVIATDDFSMAVESTKISAKDAQVNLDIRHANLMEGIEDESVDLVICNPPFHQQQRMNVEAGISFIQESARVLAKGGQFFMVANKNLGYEKHLKELFEGDLVIAQNKKYRIHMCRK